MDKCRYYAKKGNKIVYYYISAHCLTIIFTDDNDRYDTVDILLTGNTGTEVVMEIKYRRKPTYKVYDKEGHILEYDKYMSLTQSKYKNKKKLYVMIYGDYILMWDISYVTKDMFVDMKLPRTTMCDDNENVLTKVVKLKTKDCCTIIKRKPDDETYN